MSVLLVFLTSLASVCNASLCPHVFSFVWIIWECCGLSLITFSLYTVVYQSVCLSGLSDKFHRTVKSICRSSLSVCLCCLHFFVFFAWITIAFCGVSPNPFSVSLSVCLSIFPVCLSVFVFAFKVVGLFVFVQHCLKTSFETEYMYYQVK